MTVHNVLYENSLVSPTITAFGFAWPKICPEHFAYNVCIACLPVRASDYVHSLSAQVQYNDSCVVILKKVQTNGEKRNTERMVRKNKTKNITVNTLKLLQLQRK